MEAEQQKMITWIVAWEYIDKALELVTKTSTKLEYMSVTEFFMECRDAYKTFGEIVHQTQVNLDRALQDRPFPELTGTTPSERSTQSDHSSRPTNTATLTEEIQDSASYNSSQLSLISKESSQTAEDRSVKKIIRIDSGLC